MTLISSSSKSNSVLKKLILEERSSLLNQRTGVKPEIMNERSDTLCKHKSSYKNWDYDICLFQESNPHTHVVSALFERRF